MINLLPDELKKQYSYSRRNTILRWTIVAIIIIGASSVLLMLAGNFYVSSLAKAAQSDLGVKQAEISKYKAVEKKAKDLNSKVEAITEANAKTTKFSGLIYDLSNVLPEGSNVKTISLDGKPDSPLQLEVTAKDKATALKVHDSLADTKRFAFVDILQFRQDPEKAGQYIVAINLSYKTPEAAYGPVTSSSKSAIPVKGPIK